MHKKILIFTIILFLILGDVKAFSYPKPNLTAEGAILIDLNSGQVLYSKNVNERFAPASTTKIMTALITLEKCQLNDIVTVGKNPPYEDGSKIFLYEGEQVTVEQLLYAMMLESANDAALTLAEYIGGSKEGFAKMMNDEAAELGCKNTHFTNPNGLPDPDHYTSPYDLALITKKAMDNPVFRMFVSTKTYNMAPTNKQPSTRYFHNHNKMLTTRSYGYPGIDGVKTGYTVAAEHTFVGSINRNGMHLAVVIMKDKKPGYDETKQLFDYGLNAFKTEKVIDKNTKISNINAGTVSIPVYTKNDLYITIPRDKAITPVKKIVLEKSFNKIVKGEEVGYIEVTAGSNVDIKVPLVSGKDYTNMIYNLKSGSNGSYAKVLEKKVFYIPFALILSLLILRGIIKKYKKSRS